MRVRMTMLRVKFGIIFFVIYNPLVPGRKVGNFKERLIYVLAVSLASEC